MTRASQPFRHATAGHVDRDRPLWFRFDGRELSGYAGDTLASALLAHGIHEVGRSVQLGRPRGIVAAGSEDPGALVRIESAYPEPMLPATTVELYDGLVAASLAGRGRLAGGPDNTRYDAVWTHCEVLVVGAGPAGVEAARAATALGRRVILADERPSTVDIPDVRVLGRTTIVGHYDDHLLVGVERRTNHLGPAAPPRMARERLWRIRAGEVVLATGAHERPLPFPDNDRPGIMLAGSALAYLDRYGVLVGRSAVVHTNNDTALAAAARLAEAGLEIAAVADLRTGVGIATVRGEQRVDEVTLTDGRRVRADVLLVSGGWSPVLHLYSQAGGRLRFDDDLGALLPDGDRPRVRVVGAARGDGLPRCGLVAAAPDPQTFVDLQRDVTGADIARATGAGLRSVEHVKRYTTAGTALDQGKTSGLLTSATVAAALGTDTGAVGVTTFRPPYTPVGFATLAGRERGDLFDPVRVTPIHAEHTALGARFEDVGQWRRARYYPRDGEDLDAAVLRESSAVREGVGAMDVSTLGKIMVCGPDAADFLDRLYTNRIGSLAIGAVRYGVMCSLDGMVFDDGTVARLAEHEYLVTTTTGNAARVLDWMEEWSQTEWPQLRVWCTSVTEQWATVALAGPSSRAVLGRLAPGLAVDAASFPFMTWREAVVAGLPARVFRISFSGELAYEVNVALWHGAALWTALLAAGAGEGITPYGTEAMHVLRAEKGYPIIGQDTDGTVTPYDLGLGWAVAKGKDCLGKRSFTRADIARTDRKHLVGLLPRDPGLRLAEGTHIVEPASLPPPPVPYLGHVTSSYRSAALGRTFALGLVASGRERLGQTLYAPQLDGAMVPVDVVGPVLYDPTGARRDG